MKRKSTVGATRRNTRAWVQIQKLGPCADCDQYFDPACMDFDHQPGEKKTRNVSTCITIRQAQAEIEKCDLVCSNCHRLRTKNRLLAEVSLGNA